VGKHKNDRWNPSKILGKEVIEMVTVMFESPEYDESIEIGKFECVQLTYNLLRGFTKDEEEEEEIAWLDYKDDCWYFTNDFTNEYGYRQGPWSDIIIG